MGLAPERRREQRAEWIAQGLCSNCGHVKEDEFKAQCETCRCRDNRRDAIARIKRSPMPMSTRAGQHARAVIEAAREFREFLRFRDENQKMPASVMDSLAKEAMQRMIHAVAEYEKKINRPINIRRRALRILSKRKLA